MEIPPEIRRGWEKMFPDLSGKWTHWKIMGDDYHITIVAGTNLIEALKVVEENYGQFSAIKTCRATVDQDGNLLEEDEKKLYEISNFKNDEMQRKWLLRNVKL